MSWAAVAGTAGSLISSQMGGGGGGGAASPMATPSNTNFGAVTFGAKNIGTDAINAQPLLADAQAGNTWQRFIPWMVGGLVAVFALIVLSGRRGR